MPVSGNDERGAVSQGKREEKVIGGICLDEGARQNNRAEKIKRTVMQSQLESWTSSPQKTYELGVFFSIGTFLF